MQLSLDAGLVRNDHPETSVEAAQAIAPRLTILQDLLLGLLRVAPDGLTDEQMQSACRDTMTASTQRPRRVELVNLGLVVDSGERRKTRSGRNAIVWSAVL